jgi:hypothetical protein
MFQLTFNVFIWLGVWLPWYQLSYQRIPIVIRTKPALAWEYNLFSVLIDDGDFLDEDGAISSASIVTEPKLCYLEE